MKLETDSSKKTILDDNAAIYSKREERDAKTVFSNLQGAEKRRYFFDYILGKIIIIAAVAGLLIAIAYSILKPKPEVMYSVAFIDNQVYAEGKEKLQTAATDMFITDPDKQTLTFDYDYYFTNGTYDMRTKFMAQLTVGDIDCIIIPSYEIDTYAESELFVDLGKLLPEDVLSSDPSKLRKLTNSETGETIIAGYDVTDCIGALNGFEADRTYYIACVVTSKHQDRFADFFELFNAFE